MMARLVQSQLIRGMTAFFQRDPRLAEQVTQKDDQVDNLLGLIEVKCFERIAGEEPNGVRSRQLRGVFRVALNLEKLGDYAVNIAEQAVHVSRLASRPIPFDLAGPARVALAALDEVITAFTDARVGRVAVGQSEPLIWKEGDERKIDEEIREMDAWNRIVPGLVPDVKARHREDGRLSFLGQFLRGSLLRDVYITRSWDEKVRATQRLLETVRDIWSATLVKEPPRIDYARQIRERLPELFALHPKLEALRGGESRVFGIAHGSLADLLERAADLEASLAPPVSVRLHGDFNANNIVYDPEQDRVHFIDVHRSGHGDYLQDIGVLATSTPRAFRC